MRDDRHSRTPSNRSRCPVCDGATTTTSGAVCPACGRKSTSPNQLSVPDIRRHPLDTERLGYDNPIYFGIGLLSLLVFVIIARSAPDILILIFILPFLTMIRMIPLVNQPAIHEARSIWGFLFCSLVSSFGVAALSVFASAIAFCGVFLPIPGGNSISSPTSVYVWSLMAALLVFLAIFIGLWPRERSGESIHRSPDPEE